MRVWNKQNIADDFQKKFDTEKADFVGKDSAGRNAQVSNSIVKNIARMTASAPGDGAGGYGAVGPGDGAGGFGDGAGGFGKPTGFGLSVLEFDITPHLGKVSSSPTHHTQQPILRGTVKRFAYRRVMQFVHPF